MGIYYNKRLPSKADRIAPIRYVLNRLKANYCVNVFLKAHLNELNRFKANKTENHTRLNSLTRRLRNYAK